MTTSLTIATGGLTSVLSTEDDAAAQNVLIRFAHATGGDPQATAQVMLNHVTAVITDYMMRVARERYIQEESATIQEEAITNVHW